MSSKVRVLSNASSLPFFLLSCFLSFFPSSLLWEAFIYFLIKSRSQKGRRRVTDTCIHPKQSAAHPAENKSLWEGNAKHSAVAHHWKITIVAKRWMDFVRAGLWLWAWALTESRRALLLAQWVSLWLRQSVSIDKKSASATFYCFFFYLIPPMQLDESICTEQQSLSCEDTFIPLLSTWTTLFNIFCTLDNFKRSYIV